MKTYTVIRSKWYRGQGAEDSRLLREDGYSCCLGFVGAQCGIADDDMEGICAPAEIIDKGWPTWMLPSEGVEVQSRDCTQAMKINDSEHIDEPTRERELQAIFARNGDELRFVE